MTATTKTRRDLVVQALSNLGVLAAGQTAEAEDVATIDGHVDGVIAQLSAREIVNVGDPNEIPVEWLGPISVILADDAASEFGLPGIPASPSNPDPVSKAEGDLRVMTRGRPTYEPQQTEYF